MAIKFNSEQKQLLVMQGELSDKKTREFVRSALNVYGKKVEATRHSILSGPPGVGKSHGTLDECNKHNVNYLAIPSGASDIEITARLATAVYNLAENQELVVILDDADDVMFRDDRSLNRWKLATAAVNYETGMIPYYNHAVTITSTLNTLEKSGKTEIATALKFFQQDGSVGVSIPMDRVRFIVLCNKDLELPSSFSKKMLPDIQAVLDRFEYSRINLGSEEQWGWLAYTLGNSQPFEAEGYLLTDDQKKHLLDWMYANWSNLRSTSYRTVRKLAASMINNPNSYEDEWSNNLKGH